MRVEEGDVVSVNFIARMSDGRVFDTSLRKVAEREGILIEGKKYEPFTFAVGDERVLPGINKAVIGMREGEEKEITLEPEEAYGHNDEYPIEKVPLELFKKQGIEPEEGLELETPKGFAIVTRVYKDKVELKYFHPLAGQRVTFWIRVEKIHKRV